MDEFLSKMLGPMFLFALLYLGTRTWLSIKGKVVEGEECRKCGYSRIGLPKEASCPECGNAQKYPGSGLHIRRRKTIRSPKRIAINLLAIIGVLAIAYGSIKLDDYRLNYYRGFIESIQRGDQRAVERHLDKYPELAKGRFRYVSSLNDPSGPISHATTNRKNAKQLVLLLLEYGADPSASQQGNAFGFAIETNDLALAETLVDAGYAVEPDAYWLNAAILDNTQNDATIQYLLDEGMNPNHSFGVPPLIIAINHKGPTIVQHLLDAGADPDLPTEYGETPLMYAVHRQCPDCVHLLIDAGADINIVSNGESALTLARGYARRVSRAGSTADLIVEMLNQRRQDTPNK